MQFVSLGLCAVIAQVQTQTYPSLVSPDGWFKKAQPYKYNYQVFDGTISPEMSKP